MSYLQVLGLMPLLVGATLSVLPLLADVWQKCRQVDDRIDESSKLSLCTMNNASQMPMEVVLEILEAAYYDDTFEPDVQLLTTCANVCKAWSAPSQKLLFRHVSLRSNSAFLSFRAAVDRSTERGRELGDAVARLRITLDPHHPDQLAHSAFARAVRLCPNLYELDVSLYGRGVPDQEAVAPGDVVRVQRAAPSFDAGTLELLRSGPRIRSLKLANWSDNDHLTFQLLSDVWPSLSFVVLKGTPPRLPTADAPLAPFRSALSEVRMNFQTSPKLDFVQWLLQNSTQSLRTLELEREPSQEIFDLVVRQYGPSLESLSVPACTTQEQSLALRNLEALREFKTESTLISPLTLKHLADSVEHLAFAIGGDTPLHMWINHVKDKRNLRAITVYYREGGRTHSLLPNLMIACAYQGLVFRSTSDVQRFRAMVRGDPIPSSTFPRAKQPANLRTMVYLSRTQCSSESEPRCSLDSGDSSYADGDVGTHHSQEIPTSADEYIFKHTLSQALVTAYA